MRAIFSPLNLRHLGNREKERGVESAVGKGSSSSVTKLSWSTTFCFP